MTTSERLCMAMGPVMGLFIVTVLYGVDVSTLHHAPWWDMFRVTLVVMAGPNAIALRYMIRYRPK